MDRLIPRVALHRVARLPIDPTLGRMLIESKKQHAAAELLVIAAGLSVQDPRERPSDQRVAAETAHRRFVDPHSDYLTLLRLWDAVHDEWERLRTQGQRRKFCKAHFLSYTRMREWQDLHSQLSDALGDLGPVHTVEGDAGYEAIHRSILSGLLGHVAFRKERNVYCTAGNRLVQVFPGSSLHDRAEKQRPGAGPERGDAAAREKPRQPAWIVAGEIVETSQVFVRTLAGIDPVWIVQLAPHLCVTTLQNPHWSVTSGRVLVDEIITLHGMEVQRRRVAYGNFNPKDATAIFIRSALVEDHLLPEAGDEEERNDPKSGRERPTSRELLQAVPSGGSRAEARYPFLRENRMAREKVEDWQTRVRRHGLVDLDQACFEHYARHLENVSSVHDLDRVLRDKADAQFLCASVKDLVGGLELDYDNLAFPDVVQIGGQPVALAYAYAPGEEHDGVTVRLPVALAEAASASALEWAVPGLRAAKIEGLLRSLPKALRRDLMPFPPRVIEVVRDFQPSGPSFLRDLSRFVREHFGVDVPVETWAPEEVPAHLRTRVEIIGNDRKSLGAGRDLGSLKAALPTPKVEPRGEHPAWFRATRQWERFGLTAWSFGDLPERLTVAEEAGLPVYGWPGLEVEAGKVNVRLFRAMEPARRSSIEGVGRLLELALQKDLGWVQKDLRVLAKLGPLHAGLLTADELQETAFAHLRRQVLPSVPLPVLTVAHFEAAVGATRARLPGVTLPLVDRITAVLQARQQVLARVGTPAVPAGSKPRSLTLTDLRHLGQPVVAAVASAVRPAGVFAEELAALVPPDFLTQTPFERMMHLPRYLKALQLRAERATLNPPKEAERVRLLAPHLERLRKLREKPPRTAADRAQIGEYRWWVEEYKVSLFAQELGTSVPVSAARLEQAWDKVRDLTGG